MTLTAPQLLVVKNWIITNNNGIFDHSAVTALNAAASPEFVVWKTKVKRADILQDSGFNWARLDNLSIGKARIWTEIFVDGSIDPSKPNVRTGIEAVWAGTQPDLDVRAAIYVHCKRPATVFEKLLATGTGTTNDPATMEVEGPIDLTTVIVAGS